MTPFSSKGRKVKKLRISGVPGYKPRTFSCGTPDTPTANHVAAMYHTLKRRRQWAPLIAVLEGRITLAQLFDAYETGSVDKMLRELNDPDLSTLLSEWGGNATYRLQVRRMIPEGEKFPASRFTRKAVSEFLAGLTKLSKDDRTPTTEPASGSTRNRYRAALSVFAGWLVEREILEANPVREVKASKPNPAREVWLSRAQAKTLINRLPEPYNAIEALMAATGMELGAVLALHGRDIDFEQQTVHAHGSKTAWRNRVVRSTERWAWQVFANYARTKLPDAQVFTVRDDSVWKVHTKVSKAAKIPASTIHDWRHSYAVWSLRDGMRPEVIARQLGHKDPTLLMKVYGKYVPTKDDYSLTHSATPLPQKAAKEGTTDA